MERITEDVVEGLGLTDEQKDILLERLGIKRASAKIIPIWKEYVLDITYEPFCFRPFNGEVLPCAVYTEKCPGKLIGVVHEKRGASDKWVEENPDWHEKHGK